MHFRLSVDDNIWFLKEITNQRYESIFESPYLQMYKRLYEKYKLKVHLNIFYETEGFRLSQMPDKYKPEWIANSDWLKLSFHSRSEMPAAPYRNMGYDVVYRDCKLVQDEIIRFAGEPSLSPHTTIHFCQTTREGVAALRDAGVRGLVGLFGTKEKPNSCYDLEYHTYEALYTEPYVYDTEQKMYFMNNHMVINRVNIDDIRYKLAPCIGMKFIEIMIHEQYYAKDYIYYQPDFEDKLHTAVSYLKAQGYQSVFIEDILE